MLCSIFGHKPKITDSVALGGGNYWHQETCSRCGMKRQFTTHNWGKTEPTCWWAKKETK